MHLVRNIRSMSSSFVLTFVNQCIPVPGRMVSGTLVRCSLLSYLYMTYDNLGCIIAYRSQFGRGTVWLGVVRWMGPCRDPSGSMFDYHRIRCRMFWLDIAREWYYVLFALVISG